MDRMNAQMQRAIHDILGWPADSGIYESQFKLVCWSYFCELYAYVDRSPRYSSYVRMGVPFEDQAEAYRLACQEHADDIERSMAALTAAFWTQIEVFHPCGWFMLECQMLEGSLMGQRTVLPYGGKSTVGIPPKLMSPRGMASDMSVTIAVLTYERYTRECKVPFRPENKDGKEG